MNSISKNNSSDEFYISKKILGCCEYLILKSDIGEIISNCARHSPWMNNHRAVKLTKNEHYYQHLCQYLISDLINVVLDYVPRIEVYDHSIGLLPESYGSGVMAVLCSKDSRERIYVTVDDHIMKVFSLSGKLLDEWPKKMSYTDIQFSSEGKLYAIGYGDELHILEFSGKRICSIRVPYRSEKLAIKNQGRNKNKEIYFLDREGNIRVASHDLKSIREYLPKYFPKHFPDQEEFKPLHIFFSDTGELYLASQKEIRILTKEGELIKTWIPKDRGERSIEIVNMALSPFREIYISDSRTSDIYVFDLEGEFARMFKWRSEHMSRYEFQSQVVFSSHEGNQYVYILCRDCIQIFRMDKE